VYSASPSCCTCCSRSSLAYTHGAPEPVAALDGIRLVECGEPLVDIREAIPDLPVLRDSAVPWARESVVEMLANARRLLPPGFGLGLREAWRSLERQKLIYDAYFAHLVATKPGAPLATLRRMANRFFAPYYRKAPPGHSTGGAVDVWLIAPSGEPVDLSIPGSRFQSAPTFSTHVPADVRRKRLTLHDAMAAAGFTNCRDEWWHFSYGDAGWAVRTGRRACIYGAVAPPKAEYEEKDAAFGQEFLRNPPY
jgi:D-alanyl-D-alanine dipeptidase